MITTFYPDPNPETSSVDGDVSETTDAVWATIRAAAGDTADDTSATFFAGRLVATASASDWDAIYRGFTLFDTSAIPDGDTVTSATVSLMPNDANNSNFSQSLVPVKLNGAPASNTGLVASDYNITGWSPGTTLATAIAISAMTNEVYSDFALNASGLAEIIKTGITKIGWMLSGDQSDTEPTFASGGQAGVLAYSADTAGTTKDPKLVVNHVGVAGNSNSGLLGVS